MEKTVRGARKGSYMVRGPVFWGVVFPMSDGKSAGTAVIDHSGVFIGAHLFGNAAKGKDSVSEQDLEEFNAMLQSIKILK